MFDICILPLWPFRRLWLRAADQVNSYVTVYSVKYIRVSSSVEYLEGLRGSIDQIHAMAQ